MFILSLWLSVCVIILLAVLLGSLYLSVNQPSSSILLSPFECGFSVMSNSRIAFSLRFFLLCVLFLIFDIELVILFPLVWLSLSSTCLYYKAVLIFIIVLGVGLIHEWNEGSLSWLQT